MRFLVGGRRIGKTTKAIETALAMATHRPTCFITFNKDERDRLRQQYHAQLLETKLEIFSLDELELLGGVRKFSRIYVDNVDIMLMRMFHRFLDHRGGGYVDLVTATGESVRDMAIIKLGAIEMWKEAIRIVVEMHEKEDAQSLAPLLLMKFKQKIRSIKGEPEGETNVRSIRNEGTKETGSDSAPSSECANPSADKD